MKRSARYAILLFAGAADLAIGIYTFFLVTVVGVHFMEVTWMLGLGLLTILTGLYLIYRTLPVCVALMRGESVPIHRDERTVHISNRAARNAFAFLLVALLVVVSLLTAATKYGLLLTWREPVAYVMVVWMAAVIIFYASQIYYRK
ncbi:MAG: hypothetical protein ACFFCO_07060 [Promethearchaeota archaeon]